MHLVEHSTRVSVLLFTVLHRADARNSCPRLPHSVDSRFGLYHVAVVLSFLRSPALHKFDHLYFWLIGSFTDPAYTYSIFVVRFLAYSLLLGNNEWERKARTHILGEFLVGFILLRFVYRWMSLQAESL